MIARLRVKSLMFTRVFQIFCLAVIGLGLTASAAGQTLTPPRPLLSEVEGQWARYDFPEQSPIPGLDHLVLSFAPSSGQGGRTWFKMEARADTGRLFTVALEIDAYDFLYPGGSSVEVYRYVLLPADGPALEYVDAASGEARVPRLSFFEVLLPHAGRPTAPDLPLFAEGTFLGQPIERVERGDGVRAPSLSSLRVLDLDDDVLIGTSRSRRDDGTGRNAEGEYTYVELDGSDYNRMMDAGFNIFRVPLDHLQYVIDEPVWFLIRSRGGFKAHPEVLYRSNFFGATMYSDEPAFRTMGPERVMREIKSPEDAAETLVNFTRGRYYGDGKYGNGYLQRLLTEDGYHLGVELRQPFPIWETVPSAAWYEMEADVASWLFESRIQPRRFSSLVDSTLGVDFPADAESVIRYHLAFFTGAARYFGADWGMSIYGQMEEDAAELLFPMAYEQGSRFFWMWTSDHGHHVPFAEQLKHARALRDYVDENPRGDRWKRTQEHADVAVVVPWGYHPDHYAFTSYPEYDKNFQVGRLWWSRHMGLDAPNGTVDTEGDSVTYRRVIAAVVDQAAELLRSETAFDFLFLGPDQEAVGYRRVYRVHRDGTVEARSPRGASTSTSKH